jgi:hypothetical protein
MERFLIYAFLIGPGIESWHPAILPVTASASVFLILLSNNFSLYTLFLHTSRCDSILAIYYIYDKCFCQAFSNRHAALHGSFHPFPCTFFVSFSSHLIFKPAYNVSKMFPLRLHSLLSFSKSAHYFIDWFTWLSNSTPFQIYASISTFLDWT